MNNFGETRANSQTDLFNWMEVIKSINAGNSYHLMIKRLPVTLLSNACLLE